MRWWPVALCVSIVLGSSPWSLYGLWSVWLTATDQFSGPAQGTDFLNLYAGAYLLTHSPSDTYEPAAQYAIQANLAGPAQAWVPFYLPPHGALLIAWLGLLPYPVAYLL